MSTQSVEGILQNEVLTVKEVATYLRVSRVTVWRWCQRGIIPASQVGRNWRIRRDELLDLLETPQPSASSDDDSTNPAPEVDSEEQTLTSVVLEQSESVDCFAENSSSDLKPDDQDE